MLQRDTDGHTALHLQGLRGWVERERERERDREGEEAKKRKQERKKKEAREEEEGSKRGRSAMITNVVSSQPKMKE